MSEEEREQLSLNLDTSEEAKKTEEAEPEDEGEVLEWVSHPASRNKRVTAVATLFVLVVIGVVYWATDNNIWYALLATLILFGSLISFYFPTRYKLTDKKIRVRSIVQNTTQDWEKFRSYYPDKNGILLSPFLRRSRLENFRGVYIRFEGNRDEVVGFVGNRLKRSEEVKKED